MSKVAIRTEAGCISARFSPPVGRKSNVRELARRVLGYLLVDERTRIPMARVGTIDAFIGGDGKEGADYDGASIADEHKTTIGLPQTQRVLLARLLEYAIHEARNEHPHRAQ